MHIVHFLKSIDLKGGGVPRAVLDMCSGMASRGHRVVLLTGEDEDVPGAWRCGGDPWQHGHNPASVKIAVKDLRREVRGQRGYRLGADFPTHYITGPAMQSVADILKRADVLHLHGPWPAPNVQLSRLARRMSVPYVVTSHGMLDDWCMNDHPLRKKLYMALLSRRLLDGARAVHCTAQAEADQSRKHFPRGRTAVIPLLVDLTAFRTLPGPETARARFAPLSLPGYKVLCLSRLNKIKGLDRVLRAAAALKRQGVLTQLVFAGPSDPESYAQVLVEQARALGLADNLHLLGMVGAEKVSLYQAADLYIQPSIHENYGISLVESLAAGVPIITAKGVNIWPELLAGGGAAIIENTPSEAEGELTLAMATLLADPTRRAAMGAAGRRWALETLDQGRIGEQYEALYAGAPLDPRSAAGASA